MAPPEVTTEIERIQEDIAGCAHCWGSDTADRRPSTARLKDSRLERHMVMYE